MKKHFWDLIEALRRENCFVCDQRNMNYFFRSYTPRKRHDFEYNKWPTATVAERQHWNEPRRASKCPGGACAYGDIPL